MRATAPHEPARDDNPGRVGGRGGESVKQVLFANCQQRRWLQGTGSANAWLPATRRRRRAAWQHPATHRSGFICRQVAQQGQQARLPKVVLRHLALPQPLVKLRGRAAGARVRQPRSASAMRQGGPGAARAGRRQRSCICPCIVQHPNRLPHYRSGHSPSNRWPAGPGRW